MADQQQPSAPPSLSPSAQPQPHAQAQPAQAQPAQAQPAQPSQTGSQEPPSSTTPGPPKPSHPNALSESPVVPKQEPDTTGNVDLDASIEQDIDMNAGENHHNAANGAEADGAEGSGNGNGNGAGAGDGAGGFGNPVQDAVPESVDALAAAAAPSKKETSLREFMGRMDEYAPIIPDAVTAHYLTLAGLPPPGHGTNQTPPHLARLLALAAQKFIADIAADSYQYARIRASNSSSASNPMGSLNAASGLGVPAAGAGAGAAGAAAGVSGGGGESGKGKANTHLGIQRPGFGGGGSGGSGQGRTVLTMEDLGMAVGEYGVSVKRGEFYR